MNVEDYRTYDAVGLADLFERGEVSVRELLDAAMARLRLVNPAINAVINILEGEAHREGPMP